MWATLKKRPDNDTLPAHGSANMNAQARGSRAAGNGFSADSVRGIRLGSLEEWARPVAIDFADWTGSCESID